MDAYNPSPEHGLYVFCVTRGDTPRPGGEGLDGTQPLQLISAAGLAAVVCEVALAEWVGEAGEANLKDLRWLGPRAVRHELVVERTLAAAPVLPLRFGSIFSGEERLRAWLQRHGAAIAAFLDAVAGRQEWSLKGFFDPERAAAALAAEDPRLQALPASPGARYLREQKLRQEIRGSVRKWARTAGQTAAAELAPLCEQQRALTTPASGGDGKSEEVAFHYALLVAPAQLPALQAEVERLNAELAAKSLRLALGGPWPPYSFCPQLSDEAPAAQDAG